MNKSLLEQLIYALEDQQQDYLFDLENLVLVPKNTGHKLNSSPQANKFLEQGLVDLPPWSSKLGHSLIHNFISQLGAGVLKQELLEILELKKGVFKKFKEILNRSPLTMLSWQKYKNNYFMNYIQTWYNKILPTENIEIYADSLEEAELEYYYDLLLEDSSLSLKKTTEGLVFALLSSDDSALIQAKLVENMQIEFYGTPKEKKQLELKLTELALASVCKNIGLERILFQHIKNYMRREKIALLSIELNLAKEAAQSKYPSIVKELLEDYEAPFKLKKTVLELL